MLFRSSRIAITAMAALTLAAPVVAQQFSESYEFLEAVKKADGQKVTDMLKKPGSTVVNAKSRDNGETALHIVARRNDLTYLRFLLQNGANPNAKDQNGETPLLIAVNQNFGEGVDALLTYGANVNEDNSRGETPLIRAVQTRNLDLVRVLLAKGANPDQTDVIAGMSARDYAARDTRSPAIAKVMAEAPKASTRTVAGPKL